MGTKKKKQNKTIYTLKIPSPTIASFHEINHISKCKRYEGHDLRMNIIPQKEQSKTSHCLLCHKTGRSPRAEDPVMVPKGAPVKSHGHKVAAWPLAITSTFQVGRKEATWSIFSLKSLPFNSGRETFPRLLCLHLLGQNWVTCPPLAAREAEKLNILIFWTPIEGGQRESSRGKNMNYNTP